MSIMGEDKLLRFDDLGLLMDKVSYEYVKANSTLDTNTDVVTPYNVAKTMVESLCTWTKGEIFTDPNAKFLDIYCKSGIYLGLIYNELMLGLIDAISDTVKRSEHIINNMLYGACPCELSALISRKTAFGDMFTPGNIRIINNYIGLSTTERALNIKKEFNGMKFDVVIGNPPYNRGMDIDFVNLGYELSTKYCCMITPAKWQTAEADQNISSKMSYGEFRDKLVPHMSHVVFYPDSVDVFDVSQSDGISYFLLDKTLHNVCDVENRCSIQSILNNYKSRSILDGNTLWNIGYDIVKYISPYTEFKFKINNGAFAVVTNNQVSKGGGARGGVGIFNNQGNFQCIGISNIYTIENIDSAPGASDITFRSDSEAECNSFVSWLNTRFTRFFVAINISKLTGILTDHCFRFVPAPTVLDANGNRVPGKFDHIYTDAELYKTFNLPQEYIDVIEAVIKERK